MEELSKRVKKFKGKPPYNIQRGYALIIINDEFLTLKNRPGAIDLRNIKAVCDKAGITTHYKENGPLKTRNLSFADMVGLFEEMSKQGFKVENCFFCYISSH